MWHISSLGVKTSSSGNYSESGIHQLKHINEGLYGNSHSWISNEKGGGWVQFELPRIEKIDRIIWSRDRTGQFKDRLPIEYRIEIADESGQWQTIAGSWDRIPIEHSEGVNIATTTRDRLQARKALLDKQKQLISRRNALEQAPMIYGGIFRKPEITHVLHRGDPEQPGQQVTPGLSPPLGDLELSPQHSGTERRVALARWISSPANPLTARVMVNRIWQFHFGRGLVDTPSDFGLNGAPPSHPALLDWLAAEFMESGWSIKHMHRLILHSRTYRQSSRVHQAGLAKDADMRLLWRFPGRRLEGEAIRDSLLQVSGKLNLEMTGPGFDFFKKRGGLDGYPPVSQFGAQGMKRMIYAHKVRMERVPVFGAFDCPDAGQPMSRRNQSTTAIQALNLFNRPVCSGAIEASGKASRVSLPAGCFDRRSNRDVIPTHTGPPADPKRTQGSPRTDGSGKFGNSLSSAHQQQRICLSAMKYSFHNSNPLMNRRHFLGSTATGLGAVALTQLLSNDGLLADHRVPIDPARPHKARKPHFPAKAKNVLVLFCAGACSQLETWDYKPDLIRLDGTPDARWTFGDFPRAFGQSGTSPIQVQTSRPDGKDGL